MTVEKTFIQTLSCQLSSTLMQLLFSFDQDMTVEKTLIQTVAGQLSSLLIVEEKVEERSYKFPPHLYFLFFRFCFAKKCPNSSSFFDESC